MSFLSEPFGVLLNFIYNHLAFCSYGLTIIVFTLFVKILLFPLNLKQQKSTAKMQALQPELDALKETCGSDNELLMQEQNKLYAKYNVNPMSGCLPTLIQLPILLVVYNIIISPLTYIAGISTESVTKLAEIAGITTTNKSQLLVNAFFLKDASAITEEVSSIMGGESFVNMTFLKIFNLGTAPTEFFSSWDWSIAPLLLIPVLCLASQYFLQWMSTGGKKKNKKQEDPSARSMNMMLKLMPLMTFFIALTTPAGLGFYWTVSNLFTILQTYITNKFFLDKKEG